MLTSAEHPLPQPAARRYRLGALVILEQKSIGLDPARTATSVQHTNHSLVQANRTSPDVYPFPKSACNRVGAWYLRPGNGDSYPVQKESFDVPCQSLVGYDGRTTGAGAPVMAGMRGGGIEVGMATVRDVIYLTMPSIWRLRLDGRLPECESAKNAVIEFLRPQCGEAGAKDPILEYDGTDLAPPSAMELYVVVDIGTETGATATVFPSNEETQCPPRSPDCEAEWQLLVAGVGCRYDVRRPLQLSTLQRLIALPCSSDLGVSLAELSGCIPRGRIAADGLSFDISPSSPQVLATLIQQGHLSSLVTNGAGLHYTSWNGRIGTGQTPAVNRNSLHIVPRNCPARPGTYENRVFSCSLESAAGSALTNTLTNPCTLDTTYPRISAPEQTVVKAPLPAERYVPVSLLVTGDSTSNDDIMPVRQRGRPPGCSVFASAPLTFEWVYADYAARADASHSSSGQVILGGHNDGQGSSHGNATLEPRYLGLRKVLASSLTRTHWHAQVCFGALPLYFVDPAEPGCLCLGAGIRKRSLCGHITAGPEITAEVPGEIELRLYQELTPSLCHLLALGRDIGQIRGRMAS